MTFRLQYRIAVLLAYLVLLPPMLLCAPAVAALVVGGLWADLTNRIK
jgi:hypothetical protein